MSRRASGRSRRREAEPEEAGNPERWTVSYMDMVTVMMCLFIVLFAISQVDQRKFEQLAGSLGEAFGQTSDFSLLDGQDGILDAQRVNGADDDLGTRILPSMVAAVEEDQAEHHRREAVREIESMRELRAEISTDLDSHGLGGEVSFRLSDRGLVIALVTDNVFFDPASAHLPSTSGEVIDVVGNTLRRIENRVDIEGHANVLPVGRTYETNWELSGDRSVKVLRHLTESNSIDPSRLRAVAYGDAHPTYVEEDNALDLNRRVDIVILSEAPEQVRHVIAELLEQNEERS